MEFKTFLKHYLTPKDGESLKALSEFKHKNEEQYKVYRNRALRTEDYYRQQQNRAFAEGHAIAPLTAENYKTYEKSKDSMDCLLGLKPEVHNDL
ncbi:hypothetical protein [Butyrivibrio sp. AC2005]|uniref:hypothetical protein n=1 Tax=Butyrivibrio sp. AC2005 TaxID=1280672 RepID=UPI00040850A5|nr:hypothetical protein [Butyrivibrio sp. AC2005]